MTPERRRLVMLERRRNGAAELVLGAPHDVHYPGWPSLIERKMHRRSESSAKQRQVRMGVPGRLIKGK
jgi:hypothetical protein